MSLFFNTEDVAIHLPVNCSFSLENLEPFLIEVENSTLARHITTALYEEVLEKRDTNLTFLENRLLEHCRRVVAPLALANYLPFGEVQISDQGITTVSKSGDRTAAYSYQVDKLEQSCLKMGFNALETLIGFLETNTIEFSLYAQSPERTENKRLLIPSAVEFSRLYPIFESRLTYYALRPTLASLQDETLEFVLSTALLEKLKTNASTGINALSDDEKVLRDRVQKWLAFKTILEVIDLQLSIELNAGGVRINYGSMFSNTYKYYTPPGDAQRSIAKETAMRRASALWSEIGELLNKINGVMPDEAPMGIVSVKATVLF